MDKPAHVDVRREDAEWSSRIGNPAVALQRPSRVVRSGVFEWTSSARPTLTILTPREGDTVATGILCVRGTIDGGGGRIRVLVNDVRAVVEDGMFTAGVRVTPDTMILSAVATTTRGATVRHQIGVAVTETTESALRLRPRAEYGVSGFVRRFSLLPAAAVKTIRDSDGVGDTLAPGPGGSHFIFARGASPSPPSSMPATADAAYGATMTLVLAPASLDSHGSVKESGQSERRREADVEGARSALVVNPGLESRTDPPTLKQRELLPPVTPGVQTFLLGRSREGEVGDHFRRMRPGSEYSFGMLFILNSDGLWRLRWF
jgi:hypothetical protein